MYDFHDDAGNHHGNQCNIELPLKGRAQAWLGLSLLGTFRHILDLVEL